jgi:predicted RNA-binding Zn-ribbon protein involved in translation (DUF1610 family)
MKSGSLTLDVSLDALATALKSHYDECSEVISQSGESRLIIIEKYYLRTNSNALGVVLIEKYGEDTSLTHIYAGGGRSGMMGLDYGAENQFVEEIEGILLDAEAKEKDRAGTSKAKHDAMNGKSERCVVCSQPLRKGDTLVMCPSCGAKAHRTHMLEWLHTRGYCPSCHSHLNESELKSAR